MNIRESQIEDILATYTDITREILGLTKEITLLSRQKVLPSGNKLDLLFIAGTKLLPIELKVEKFQRTFLDQIKDYVRELQNLQSQGKLISGKIKPFLLCSEIGDRDKLLCVKENVVPIEYSPQNVLEGFFTRLKNLANFIMLKPTNHGLWSLHLLNRLLYILDKPKIKDGISKSVNLSLSTVGSYLRLAEEMCLVQKENERYSLTNIGKKYVWNRDPNALIETISNDQARVIQDLIIKNPFASGAIFGIYVIVETVFNLSKNTYPVPMDLVINYFRESSGRYFEWSAPKSASDSMKMYSNYATEIGLIGRIGDKFYITPDGVRFILLLHLHKTIKIVDALGISR